MAFNRRHFLGKLLDDGRQVANLNFEHFDLGHNLVNVVDLIHHHVGHARVVGADGDGADSGLVAALEFNLHFIAWLEGLDRLGQGGVGVHLGLAYGQNHIVGANIGLRRRVVGNHLRYDDVVAPFVDRDAQDGWHLVNHLNVGLGIGTARRGRFTDERH